MRILIRIIVMAFIGSLIGRKIFGRARGSDGLERFMAEAVPKIAGKAFAKLPPAKRREVLARWRAMLDGLEEQYGRGGEGAGKTEA